jgi:hypothetical protein
MHDPYNIKFIKLQVNFNKRHEYLKGIFSLIKKGKGHPIQATKDLEGE